VASALDKRILIVERPGAQRDSVEALLVRLGYRVTVAEAGDALERMRAGAPIDVMLVDLSPEEARQLRLDQQRDAKLANVPWIAVGEPGECEAEAYVARPIDAFALYEQLIRAEAVASATRARDDVDQGGEPMRAFLRQGLSTMANRLPELTARLQALQPDLASAKDLLSDGGNVESDLSYLEAFGSARPGVRAARDVRETLEFVIAVGLPRISRRASVHKTFAEVPRVMATEEQLGQVFSSIIINAAQAIPLGDPDGNRIDVLTFPDANGWAVVQVTDTGCGIPKELHTTIFEPFYSTKRGLGLGIGLYLVRSIVSQLGGRISVQSEVGHGSTFQVALPPAPEP
jgi:signal transduction histidine kinase